ncbi:PREDICTED: cell wall integrity and stress response component 4-like [Cyprinodon variegatus]|uniref:cell wall integrity and stress response component 4-like n=1 Tax=Cyprinodon variegatus TaxID=28743 RepID=UPI000742618F|nr:PREDICTED: cell wall integrity and stress response component 4-like [Cyprinodon variegatus]
MRGTLRITWPLLSLSIISGVLSNTTMQQDSTATTVTNTVTVSHILSTVQASTAQSIETPESKATTKIPLVDPATVHKEGSTEQSATTTTPSTTVAIVPTPQSTPSVAVLTASTSPSVGLNNPVTTVSSTTPEVKTTAKVVNQPTVPQSTATTVPDSIVQTTTVKTSGASGVSTEKPGQLGIKETLTTSVAGLSAGRDTQTTPLTRMDDRNIAGDP